MLCAALALAAPLAHAHLDAAGGVAAPGLCGEHAPLDAPAPETEACPVCLAGGQATLALGRAVPSLALQTPTRPMRRFEPPATPPDATRSPGAPRAPPTSA